MVKVSLSYHTRREINQQPEITRLDLFAAFMHKEKKITSQQSIEHKSTTLKYTLNEHGHFSWVTCKHANAR